MEHQFNLGSAIQPAPFIPRNDPDAPLYASVDGVAALLSDDEVVFQVRGSNNSQVMTHQVLQCMASCREFRPLDEHIARIMRSVPGLKDAARVRQGLEALARSGLLQSDQQFLDGLRAAAVQPAPSAGACIRACDRPAQVERLLKSMATSEERFGARRPLLLIDDSRKSAHAKSNQDLLRDYARQTGVDARYVGARERHKLLKAVTKDLPAIAAQASDLLGMREAASRGGGSGWNTALLLTAGRRLLLLDEDFELPLRRHENYRPGLDLQPQQKGHARFYASLEAALSAGQPLDDDPLAQHLDCVGQPLGALLERPDLTVQRDDLRGLEWTRVQRVVNDARVVSTMNGTRGAHGGDSGHWMYLLDADSRADFWRDRDSYLHNIEGQSLWFGYPRAHPAEQSYFTPFALDNSVLLPCTAPTGGNEDALFGTLLRMCHPHSVTLHLPDSIGHVQEAARRRSAKTLQALTPGLTSFVHETLQNRFDSVHAADPAQRLMMAANLLDDLACAGEAERIGLLREYLNYTRADLIARLQKRLADARDAPLYWQTDVREIITANGRAMILPGSPRLGDWPVDADPATCARLLREQLHTFAAGLRAWPQLWQWARERGAGLLASL